MKSNEEIIAAYEKENGQPHRPTRSTDPDDRGLTPGDAVKIFITVSVILVVIVYFTL